VDCSSVATLEPAGSSAAGKATGGDSASGLEPAGGASSAPPAMQAAAATGLHRDTLVRSSSSAPLGVEVSGCPPSLSPSQLCLKSFNQLPRNSED
jgi:hypothetical protein